LPPEIRFAKVGYYNPGKLVGKIQREQTAAAKMILVSNVPLIPLPGSVNFPILFFGNICPTGDFRSEQPEPGNSGNASRKDFS